MTRAPSLRSVVAGTGNPVVQVLVETRALRGFADGVVSVVLAGYLISLGFGPRQIGWITTATLIGSAVGTISVGVLSYRWPRYRLLLTASVLMALTGLGFLLAREYWLLMAIAFVGTVNPSTGDVSAFLPLEQAEIAHQVTGKSRTSIFARFSLAANLAASIGALLAGAIAAIAARQVWSDERTGTIGFAIYVLVGLWLFHRYGGLPRAPMVAPSNRVILEKSRSVVLRLAFVFSLDSLGGGFVVQTMLIVWLHERHGMSEAAAGVLFSATSLLSAFSMLAAPRVAERIGLVNAMVFTHLPANIFLMLAPLMPNLPLAVLMLLLRSSLSSMDIPPRTAYVMAVVKAEERSAAASITNVPRSLASAVTPAIAGQMLSITPFGWPLIVGGALKAGYDLILWRMFRRVEVLPDQTTQNP